MHLFFLRFVVEHSHLKDAKKSGVPYFLTSEVGIAKRPD